MTPVDSGSSVAVSRSSTRSGVHRRWHVRHDSSVLINSNDMVCNSAEFRSRPVDHCAATAPRVTDHTPTLHSHAGNAQPQTNTPNVKSRLRTDSTNKATHDLTCRWMWTTRLGIWRNSAHVDIKCEIKLSWGVWIITAPPQSSTLDAPTRCTHHNATRQLYTDNTTRFVNTTFGVSTNANDVISRRVEFRSHLRGSCSSTMKLSTVWVMTTRCGLLAVRCVHG